MSKYEIIEVSVSDLIPYENNPRQNDEAVGYVANSIKEFGFKVPIVIDQNNVIVTGHTRLKAAQKLGMETVPCIMANDLTPEQVKAYRLADNKTGEIAEWDFLKLDQELGGILDVDMAVFGFDDIMHSPEESDELYTEKVETPTYEITGDKPEPEELVDSRRTEELLRAIEESGVSDEDKHFLRMASYRHLRFNYSNIAEYYAHADEELQELMEDNALVIIDYDKAIEQGYVVLSEQLGAMIEDEEE